MKLKNANPNSWIVVINNLHSMLLFFPKILKIELHQGLQSLFYSRESMTTHKLEVFITFISSIKVEWLKAFHVSINLEKQI